MSDEIDESSQATQIGSLAQDTHDRAESAYERWNDAWTKYHYYVVGIIAAFFAYIAKDYHLNRGSCGSWLELAGILLLLASGACGLKHLESTVFSLNLQFERRLRQYKIVQDKQIIEGGDYENASTGKVVSPRIARERMGRLQESMTDIDRVLSGESATGARLYRWRDGLFIAALVALVTARVFKV